MRTFKTTRFLLRRPRRLPRPTAKSVIIIGAGGHAKVIIELLRSSGYKPAVCIGDADSPDECHGVPVLQGDHQLEPLRAQGLALAFVAIGNNALRRQLGLMALQYGFTLVNAISPTAVISPTVHLGQGIAVMAGAVINAASVIDDFVIINTGATIDHDCTIGEACHIAPQCGLAGNVSVGMESFLGIGCSVVPGRRIGHRTAIGAGGVVVADIPDNVLAKGIPAKISTPRC